MKVLPALLLVVPLSLTGQSVSTVIGGSQVLGTAGVQTQFQYKGRFGWTGVGYYEGLVVGGYLNTPLRVFAVDDTSRDKYRLGIGDHELDAILAVDEFDYHRAPVRGVSVFRRKGANELQVFAGKYSFDGQEPYLHSIYHTNPSLIGAVTWGFRPSKRSSVESYNVFGDTGVTSIQSLSWKPDRTWKLSAAGGAGNSHPYLAGVMEYQRKSGLDLRAAYTVADNKFHRQDGTYDLEPLGFNGKADIPLGENATFHLYHRHELTVVPKYLGFPQDSSIGTIDFAGVTTAFFGFHTSVDVTQSSSNLYRGNNYAGIAFVSRKVIPRWTTMFSYLRNVSETTDMEVFQNTNDVRVSNRLSLSHNVNWIDGAVNNKFGGRWSSNWISFSADNQVYYSPVAAQFGQKAVFQAWNFTIRVRTPHGTSTHLETTVDAAGKTRWGGYLSGLQYHAINAQSGGDMQQHVNFTRYIVEGKVVDETGKGVWGVAILIGGDMAMSDHDGSFFTHVKSSKPMAFGVSAGASLQMSNWKLAAAPSFVVPGKPVTVVIQMVKQTKETAAR